MLEKAFFRYINVSCCNLSSTGTEPSTAKVVPNAETFAMSTPFKLYNRPAFPTIRSPSEKTNKKPYMDLLH